MELSKQEMFLICSKGFKINYYATKIVVPLKSDNEIKDQVPASHGIKRLIDSQAQCQTMFSENFKIDHTLKSGHNFFCRLFLYFFTELLFLSIPF